jgi:hypothetical protein
LTCSAFVIPAQAGIQNVTGIFAVAARDQRVDPGVRRDDEKSIDLSRDNYRIG